MTSISEIVREKKWYFADIHSHPELNQFFLGRDLRQRTEGPWLYNPLRNQVDLRRIREGRLGLVTWVTFSPPIPGFSRLELARQMWSQTDEVLAGKSEEFLNAGAETEVPPVPTDERTLVVRAIESSRTLDEDPDALPWFAERGLRYLTLVHFFHSALGEIASMKVGIEYLSRRRTRGLTELGRQMIKACEQLGVLVDVCHMAEKTFWDTLDLSTRPLLASHVGCRHFANIPCNLSDEMMRALAGTGGVIGIIAWSWLLAERGLWVPRRRLVKHILHAVEVAGIDHVGIGSDWDGYIWSPRGFQGPEDFAALAQDLQDKGLTDEEVYKLLGGNYRRLLRAGRASTGGDF